MIINCCLLLMICVRCCKCRYREFEELLNKIKKIHSSEAGLLKLLGKMHIGSILNPDFIEGRRVGLNKFVINLMQV